VIVTRRHIIHSETVLHTSSNVYHLVGAFITLVLVPDTVIAPTAVMSVVSVSLCCHSLISFVEVN